MGRYLKKMLILSGGGDPAQVREIDAYFLSVVDPKKPIVYLPVAMEPETFTYEQCFSWFRETYEPLGIRNVELWTDLQGKNLSSQNGNCKRVK